MQRHNGEKDKTRREMKDEHEPGIHEGDQRKIGTSRQ
jgi:hypothetical protein